MTTRGSRIRALATVAIAPPMFATIVAAVMARPDA
jgi:hypothetical protein